MLFSSALEALALVAFAAGFVVPLLAWAERKQSVILSGGDALGAAGASFAGLLQPLADGLKLLGKEDSVPHEARRAIFAFAPVLALVLGIAALAVIPFAGRYAFGDESYSPVLADLDWGLLYVLALGALAAWVGPLAGWSSGSRWSMLGGVRAAARTVSCAIPLGLSLVGVFMVFGTLRLSEIAAAQDGTLRLFAFVEALGLGPLPQALEKWVVVPAWGVFLQPLGCVLFAICALAQAGQPPFDTAEAGEEVAGGYASEYSGTRHGLFVLAQRIEGFVIAALVVLLFFGGWSLPYLSQATIIQGVLPLIGSSLAGLFGAGFATLVCIVLHVTCFLAKLVVVVSLQNLVRWSLPRFRYDRLMDLCWKGLLPLGVFNLFATAGLMLALGAA